MAMFESHILDDMAVHLEGRGVQDPEVEPHVLVRLRVTFFDSSADEVFLPPATIHCFHLGAIPLLMALPGIASGVVDNLDDVPPTDRRICRHLLLRFFSEAAASEMMNGSAFELIVDIGLLVGPRGSNDDVELMLDCMLENPPEEEEEMAEAVYDYRAIEIGDLLEDHGAGSGDDEFGGVPASSSFIKTLQRSRYGRGDEVREEQCMICLDEFDAGAEVTTLPCSHTFHSQCIIQWLERSHLCPACRYQMPTS